MQTLSFSCLNSNIDSAKDINTQLWEVCPNSSESNPNSNYNIWAVKVSGAWAK